jgi:predicted RNA binding protein YcfA (HicA-like mRNA interferase family)
LKPRELIRLLEAHGCQYHRQGKGDHTLYVRHAPDRKRVVPIDMGQSEFSPAYVIRMLRQFGYTEAEIDSMLG